MTPSNSDPIATDSKQRKLAARYEEVRLPRKQSWLSLSEALSWIAFDHSMGKTGIYNFLTFCDFQETGTRLEELGKAVGLLADFASDGKILMRGKYVEHDAVNEISVPTPPIPAEAFHDFTMFDINCDGLKRGSGVVWPGHFDSEFFEIPIINDGFSNVFVARAGLLLHFPPSRPPVPSSRTTGTADIECAEWLTAAFKEDPDNKKNKQHFAERAKTAFEGRLSARGFERAWSKVATAAGRSKPGRKS